MYLGALGSPRGLTLCPNPEVLLHGLSRRQAPVAGDTRPRPRMPRILRHMHCWSGLGLTEQGLGVGEVKRPPPSPPAPRLSSSLACRSSAV